METPTTNKLLVMALTATATVAFFTTGLIEERLTPSRVHAINLEGSKKSWDEYLRSPYYAIARGDIQSLDQAIILHNFAVRLLENSQNLDSSIAKIINKNFSKLL